MSRNNTPKCYLMTMTLKKEWQVADASQPSYVPANIPAGTHEVERVPNPYGNEGDWLVLKGTKIGAKEEFWRKHSAFAWDEHQVTIEG